MYFREWPLRESSLVLSTLNTLEASSVGYCIFKSTDQTLAGLRGQTDLDLLIDENHISDALHIFKKAGFKETTAGYSTCNPYRFGLIGYCPYYASQVYIDIMTRVVIGINRYRQYRSLDAANALISKSIKSDFGLFAIDHSDELKWLHFRLIAKTRLSLPLLDYFAYRLLLKYSFNYENLRLINLMSDATDEITRHLIKFKSFNYTLYKKNRSLLEKESRSLIPSNLGRVTKELYALAQKVQSLILGYHFPFPLFKRKTLRSGVLVFVVGIDGSGKSTLSKNLHSVLSWKLDSYRIYLGAGDGPGSFIRILLSKLSASSSLSSLLRQNSKLSTHSGSKIVSANLSYVKLICRILWASVICREKQRKYRLLCRLLSQNYIVIADRFPNLNPSGNYDAPQLSPLLTSSNPILRAIANWENNVYSQYTKLPIHLCIELNASIDLVNSRSESFSEYSFTLRKKAMTSALSTLNIKEVLNLDADNNVHALTNTCIKKIFQLND